MVTSPTGKGVIAMGGTYSKEMFELTQSMEWTRLEQTLQIEHNGGPLAIPIPDEFVYKKVESEDVELQCSLPENRPSVKQHLCSKKNCEIFSMISSLPEDHSSVKHYIVKNCEFL